MVVSILVLSCFFLHVADTPSISVTPSNSTVRVGTSLLLTCTLATNRNSTFSWMVNGSSIASNGRYEIINRQANQSILNINRLESTDIGEVQCSGQDPLHIAIASAASVVEVLEPYIVGDGSGTSMMNVQINTTLILLCELRGRFNGSPSIRWFLGSRELTNDTVDFEVGLGGNTSKLRKINVGLSDEAGYLCKVELPNSQVMMMTFNVFVTSKLSYDLCMCWCVCVCVCVCV